MKFGHFDDQAREYVIDTPRTPYPWINYLGCEKFFGIISNTAGGYCFYRDARLRRITRYRYNNMPVDNGGRYFYINDNGTIWNPDSAKHNERPCKCHHRCICTKTLRNIALTTWRCESFVASLQLFGSACSQLFVGKFHFELSTWYVYHYYIAIAKQANVATRCCFW